MSKKTFNPTDWVPDKSIQNPKSQESLQSLGTSNDIEEITRRIESSALDIAPNYADWRDLGFALADALGESGRNYYHRLSRFYPSYSQSETDKQYSACLASHGHGVTIKTLYHLAKSAGVSVSISQPSKSPSSGGVGEAKSPIPQNGDLEEMGNQEKQLPAFPKEIFETSIALYEFIQNGIITDSKYEFLLNIKELKEDNTNNEPKTIFDIKKRTNKIKKYIFDSEDNELSTAFKMQQRYKKGLHLFLNIATNYYKKNWRYK